LTVVIVPGADVEAVHVVPLTEIETGFVPDPPATQYDPFHATQFPPPDQDAVCCVQVVPSVDVAIEGLPALPPTDTHSDPLHATPLTLPVIGVVCPVQVIPSEDVRIRLVPEETAPPTTQYEPFHATQLP
jgi:hypothetical protein